MCVFAAENYVHETTHIFDKHLHTYTHTYDTYTEHEEHEQGKQKKRSCKHIILLK